MRSTLFMHSTALEARTTPASTRRTRPYDSAQSAANLAHATRCTTTAARKAPPPQRGEGRQAAAARSSPHSRTKAARTSARFGHGHLSLRPVQKRQRPAVREEGTHLLPRPPRQTHAGGGNLPLRLDAVVEVAVGLKERQRLSRPLPGGPAAIVPRHGVGHTLPGHARAGRGSAAVAALAVGRDDLAVGLLGLVPAGLDALPQPAQDTLGLLGGVEVVQPPLHRRPVLLAASASSAANAFCRPVPASVQT